MITANGVSLRLDTGGAGARLLFLNGTGGTIEQIAPLVGLFRSRFEVAVFDQRGLGESGSPPGVWTMADYAADALAVADHLRWSTFSVIGLSFGGMVAQELVVTWPGRVNALVLACTSPGGALASYPLHELEDLDASARAAHMTLLMDTRFTQDWLAGHPGDAGLMSAINNRQRPSDPARLDGMLRQLQARAGHDVLDRLHLITCPTLVAAGRYDGIAPLANSEAIAARIPGARLAVFEGGHAFFGQDRTAIPTIMEFCATHA